MRINLFYIEGLPRDDYFLKTGNNINLFKYSHINLIKYELNRACNKSAKIYQVNTPYSQCSCQPGLNGVILLIIMPVVHEALIGTFRFARRQL